MNRFLYLYDCERLVSSIQECVQEVVQIMGEFYLTLNVEGFLYPPLKPPDGIRFTRSPVTTKLFAYLNPHYDLTAMHVAFQVGQHLVSDDETCMPSVYLDTEKSRDVRSTVGSARTSVSDVGGAKPGAGTCVLA